MEKLTVYKAAKAAGQVQLPGSKSISNRALLLAALSEGETVLTDLLESDDTRYMRAALKQLGVALDDRDGATRVSGCGGAFSCAQAQLFLGNAGTAVRSLTAALAMSAGRYEIDGVARMRERPIADLVDALQALGCAVDYHANEGYLPLSVGGGSSAGDAQVSVRGDVSSQFLTGLLLAAPLREGATRIDVDGALISRPYVDMTLNLMQRFGVTVERPSDQAFVIAAGSAYRSPGQLSVEGDASSASYFLAAGAIAGRVRVNGVGRTSVQGDIHFATALETMGAQVLWGDDWIEVARPEGLSRLRAFDLDLLHIPDAAMTLAVAALFADGPSTLRNIGSWRVKETDRIAAMATELKKLGAMVESGSDWMRVTPGTLRSGVNIDTYDDHRVAMCFALVALAGVDVNILDPGCTAKTFPDFFERLDQVLERE